MYQFPKETCNKERKEGRTGKVRKRMGRRKKKGRKKERKEGRKKQRNKERKEERNKERKNGHIFTQNEFTLYKFPCGRVVVW